MNQHRYLVGGFARRLRTGLLATALMVAAATIVLPGAANAAPPGDRANFTVALMKNAGTQSFVRLAQYSLRADNSARADYWAWNAQDLQPRVPSGLTSSGCANNCGIWTTDGFQNAPQQLFGTWKVIGDNLSITWTSGSSGTERWQFTNLPTITKVALVSHPTANRGWGWGSKVGFGSALSARQVFDTRTVLNGRYSQNNWGTVDDDTTSLRLTPGPTLAVKLCNDHCINLSNPENKAYLAGSGADRRMYYNHERYEVFSDPCMEKGHLKPALQVLDDNGAFRGLIMAEASLYLHTWGSNILGIYDLNNIE